MMPIEIFILGNLVGSYFFAFWSLKDNPALVGASVRFRIYAMLFSMSIWWIGAFVARGIAWAVFS